MVWLGHLSHAGGQPPTDGGTAPLPTPTTRRLQRARGWGPALCTPVPFGPSGSSSPASPAGPLNRLDRRPCTNTRYFSLRLTSAYPCHKLSPASTEGFQACVSREVWVHPRTGKRGPPQLTGGGEPLPRGDPGWATGWEPRLGHTRTCLAVRGPPQAPPSRDWAQGSKWTRNTGQRGREAPEAQPSLGHTGVFTDGMTGCLGFASK